MRVIAFVFCFFALPWASLAQNNPAWSSLTALHAGQKIQIIETNAKKHSGAFMNVSDTAISYQENAGQQTIQKQDVRTVKLMDNKHRLRNTIIGAAVGAGVGAGIGAAVYKPCSGSFCIDPGGRALPAGIGAVVGGLGGVVVGALLPSHSTIYNVSPP